MPVMRNLTTHFSRNPVTIDKSRSTFDESNTLLTSFKVGDLIPIYCDPDILPGDTIKVSTSSLLRMTTPIFPVMDNSYLDYFWFFTPNRVSFTQWPEFMGEADPAAYTSPTVPVYPTVTVTPAANNVAGYFGLPFGKQCTVSALPFRAYRIIWNEWFRDQNTQNYETVSKASGVDANDYTGILKANKYKDWFTSALPSPQKGIAVNVLQNLVGTVTTSATMTGTNNTPLKFTTGFSGTQEAYLLPYFGVPDGNKVSLDGVIDADVVDKSTDSLGGPINLYAMLPSMSVNALRLAVQTQRLLELDARGGSRYIEQIYSHFGVRSPDARLQRPEYLGGGHVTINMMQVLQNSATSSEPTPIGHVSAYSKTVNSKFDFERSFTEHGVLMCLACVRTALSYQQGIEPGWLRRDRYDFYYPTLANIGEQPILNKYLYYQNNATVDNQVFGYGEAWADYRTKRSHITGLLNSAASGSLDAWHYGENFSSLPTLSAAFMKQSRAPFLRSLAVQDQDDFVANFYFEMYYTRVMPTYSIPGLVDHF